MDPTEDDWRPDGYRTPAVDAVLATVAAAFEVTGADTPGWPAPHPGREPLEQEYSRVTDPHKYRIAGARADAWLEALASLGIADWHDVDPTGGLWRDVGNAHPPDRARVVVPRAPGALPMLLTYRNGTSGWAAGVGVSLCTGAGGPPAVSVGLAPDCGCDACDDGSDGVLVCLDESILHVVTGRFVHVLTPTHTITATETGHGWGRRMPDEYDDAAGIAGAARDHEPDVNALVAQARAGSSPYPHVVGGCWLPAQLPREI
ncbi:MAG: DUF6226 family protein [Nocardioides sp.]